MIYRSASMEERRCVELSHCSLKTSQIFLRDASVFVVGGNCGSNRSRKVLSDFRTLPHHRGSSGRHPYRWREHL